MMIMVLTDGGSESRRFQAHEYYHLSHTCDLPLKYKLKNFGGRWLFLKTGEKYFSINQISELNGPQFRLLDLTRHE